MRAIWLVAVLSAAGCGDDGGGVGKDGGTTPDARPDAPPDAPPDAVPDAACETVLLVGGQPLAPAWTIVQQGPATLDYGADYTRITTSTNTNAPSGGQLLIWQPLPTGTTDFKLEVVVALDAVHAHNLLDADAAILGSFTPSVGNQTDRSEMIYLDPGAIGWSDETQSHAVALNDGAYHTVVLAVAAGAATVTVDGTAALTRATYTTNGSLAFGDQTNDATYDATIRFKSIKLLCP